MKQLPSRLRRLDGALADLPLDEPMLLTELDGFLTGIVLSPEPILPAEWLQDVWGSDDGGMPPFDEPADVQWFADAVTAYRDGIARDLARGKPRPIFDIDERHGDVLWELWIDGFAQAMALRPESWAALAVGEDRDMADAFARLSTLIAIANNDSDLDSVEINALNDGAPAELIDCIARLQLARGVLAPTPVRVPPAKVGRNDPCPCGSGRKFKRCCG